MDDGKTGMKDDNVDSPQNRGKNCLAEQDQGAGIG